MKKYAILEASEKGCVSLYLFDTEKERNDRILSIFNNDPSFQFIEAKKDGKSDAPAGLWMKDNRLLPKTAEANRWFVGSYDDIYYWYHSLEFEYDPAKPRNVGIIDFSFEPGLTVDAAAWNLVLPVIDTENRTKRKDITYCVKEMEGSSPYYSGSIIFDLNTKETSFEHLS